MNLLEPVTRGEPHRYFTSKQQKDLPFLSLNLLPGSIHTQTTSTY